MASTDHATLESGEGWGLGQTLPHLHHHQNPNPPSGTHLGGPVSQSWVDEDLFDSRSLIITCLSSSATRFTGTLLQHIYITVLLTTLFYLV